MAGVVGDAIPEDAKRHLNNAQRELFTALFLIYRHQAMGRREGFEAAVRARAAPAPAPRRRSRAGAGSRPKTRTTRIDIS
jgi:hypothetical protein